MQDVGFISGRSLGEGSGNLLRILAWEIPWTAEPGGSQKSRFTDEMTPTRISLKVKESFSKNNHKSLKKNNDSYFIYHQISSQCSKFPYYIMYVQCMCLCVCVFICVCVCTRFLQIKVQIRLIYCNYLIYPFFYHLCSYLLQFTFKEFVLFMMLPSPLSIDQCFFMVALNMPLLSLFLAN